MARKTRETEIRLTLCVDGTGATRFRTGLPFLEHMLDCLCRQALFDLGVRAAGDVEVDDHHLAEDLGLALGEALAQALGDKAGIRRFGAGPGLGLIGNPRGLAAPSGSGRGPRP